MPFDPAIVTAPFRMQPGLRRLAHAQRQLTPTRPGDAFLAAKLAVLQHHSEQALCSIAEWDAGPALSMLAAQAADDHPHAWSPIGGDGFTARLLGWTLHGDRVEGSGEPAIGDRLRSLPAEWRLAGLLSLAFAEDLAIIDGSPHGNGRIPWLAVCLPSRWSPQAKVGRSFADVHAPVADNASLLRAASSLPQLVCGTQRWRRHVWTITPNPSLDAHPDRQPGKPWPNDATATEIAEMAWLRTECQTFLPLADHQQAVFTIKLDMVRLVDTLADPQQGADSGRALCAALASMSDAVLAYRGLDTAKDRLLDWLASRHAA